MAKSKKKKRKYPKLWEPPAEWEVPELDLDKVFSIENALLTGSEFIEKYALVSGRKYLHEHPNSLPIKDAYHLNEKYAQNLRRVNPYQIKYDTANIIDYRKYKYAKENKDIATVADEYFQKHKDDPLKCITPYFSEAFIYGLDSNNIFYYRITEMGSDHIDFDVFCMVLTSPSTIKTEKDVYTKASYESLPRLIHPEFGAHLHYSIGRDGDNFGFNQEYTMFATEYDIMRSIKPNQFIPSLSKDEYDYWRMVNLKTLLECKAFEDSTMRKIHGFKKSVTEDIVKNLNRFFTYIVMTSLILDEEVAREKKEKAAAKRKKARGDAITSFTPEEELPHSEFRVRVIGGENGLRIRHRTNDENKPKKPYVLKKQIWVRKSHTRTLKNGRVVHVKETVCKRKGVDTEKAKPADVINVLKLV